MMCIRNLILTDNTSSNIWLNIPVNAQMYKLNGLWCGLLTCVNCIFILIPLWPCVCISIHVRVYKLARNWSKVELNRTHPTILLWTTRSTINYATENAVLSLCSMNIAKNHWVTLKCTVIHISLHMEKSMFACSPGAKSNAASYQLGTYKISVDLVQKYYRPNVHIWLCTKEKTSLPSISTCSMESIPKTPVRVSFPFFQLVKYL